MQFDSTAQYPGDAHLVVLTDEVRKEFPDAWVDPIPFTHEWIEEVHASYIREHQPVGRLEYAVVHELAHAEISLAQLRALSAVIDEFAWEKRKEAPEVLTVLANSPDNPERLPCRAAIIHICDEKRVSRFLRMRAMYFRFMMESSAELRRLQKARRAYPAPEPVAVTTPAQPPKPTTASRVKPKPKLKMLPPPSRRPSPNRREKSVPLGP